MLRCNMPSWIAQNLWKAIQNTRPHGKSFQIHMEYKQNMQNIRNPSNLNKNNTSKSRTLRPHLANLANKMLRLFWCARRLCLLYQTVPGCVAQCSFPKLVVYSEYLHCVFSVCDLQWAVRACVCVCMCVCVRVHACVRMSVSYSLFAQSRFEATLPMSLQVFAATWRNFTEAFATSAVRT